MNSNIICPVCRAYMEQTLSPGHYQCPKCKQIMRIVPKEQFDNNYNIVKSD